MTIRNLLNPLSSIGNKDYPVWLPLLIILPLTIVLELYFVGIRREPMAVGFYAIYLYAILIIYSAFRAGVKGGMIAMASTILYYLYIIVSRGYQGEQLRAGLVSTFYFGVLYTIIARTIGWLREKLDEIMNHEMVHRKWLWSIIRQLPVGILVTDKEGMLLETNSKLEEVVGEKFEKGWLAGVSQAKIFYPKQDKRVSAEKHPLKIAIDTGRVVSSEYRVRNNHGKSRHVRVSAAPITWKNDEIVAGVAVYHDITQIREDEKRRYDFVNIASHELKTPITSLVLFSEILKKKLTTEDLADAKEIVKKMEKQTGNLQELVNNLLEASRMQSGKLTYKDEEFEMDELIREAVLALEDRERGPRIKINGLPKVRVKGDRFRIYQVLTNLIMNANKFSPKKEEVKIEMMNKQDKIQVSVKDRGSGIQKNEQKKIFDKLYQAGDPQHQTYPGMGMGLYIAKQIVRHHRGRIWVESEVGKGAKFVFEIPKGGR